MKKINKRKISITVTALSLMLMLAYIVLSRVLDLSSLWGAAIAESVETIAMRVLGGIVFVTIAAYSEYRVLDPLKKPFWRSMAFALPAFAVVINNLPIYSLATGRAIIYKPLWSVFMLAGECLAVGFFEESCFRGVVLLGFLKGRREGVKDRFVAIALSSAVFGLVHLLNIFNSNPLAVLLQIGYSFLIGAMCSVVLIKTANLWLCVALHAIFNFCGALVPRCGYGYIWDPLTIAVTATLAVLTGIYMLIAFLRLGSSELDRLYKTDRMENKE